MVRKFQEITEAYAILSDQEKRRLFDEGGQENLSSDRTSKPNARDVFNSFFSNTNPFSDFGFGETVEFGSKVKEIKKKTPVVEIPIDCSLNELFYGCLKKVKVSRKRVDDNASCTVNKDEILDIVIEPGDFNGKRISFPGEGDETIDSEAGDIDFIIREIKHPHFIRDKNDLKYTCELTLCEALTDCYVHIPTLSDRTLSVPCPEILSPESKKIIQGEGMPIVNKRGGLSSRGDLIVSFQIHFPKTLSQTTKNVLKDYLGTNTIIEQ